MRLRVGFFVGLSVGYYLGAMAGRQRYEQLNGLFRKVKGSRAMDLATGRAKTVVDSGYERTKEKIGHVIHHTGTSVTNSDLPSEFSSS